MSTSKIELINHLLIKCQCLFFEFLISIRLVLHSADKLWTTLLTSFLNLLCFVNISAICFVNRSWSMLILIISSFVLAAMILAPTEKDNMKSVNKHTFSSIFCSSKLFSKHHQLLIVSTLCDRLLSSKLLRGTVTLVGNESGH